MEASASTEQPQRAESVSRGQRQRPRRGRRGGGETRTTLSLRPASVAPEPSSSNASILRERSNPETGISTESSSRGRGRGRSRGGRPNQDRTVNGRQFGGQLTRHDTNATESLPSAQLQAGATEFVPGQPISGNVAEVRPKPQTKAHRPHKRRLSKSQAPDIASRVHEDIDNAQYECMICFSEVQRNSKVWSCNTCWTVFHLTCIKKWAKNEGSAAAHQNQPEDGEAVHPRQWRCPGCNLPKTQAPHTYSCWCEKEVDPRPLPGLPPHSCGNTCGKDRKCPHPCPLTCHAGPCPSCSHMGPTQICFCGKHEVTKRCSETNYDSGWSCGEICGELMACGEHFCPRTCHEGYCSSCEAPILARCYCGKVEKQIPCHQNGDIRESHRFNFSTETSPSEEHSGDIISEPVAEVWQGSFDCGNICGRTFDCGKHQCQKPCHVQSAQAHCPYSPDVVTQCPCGKTLLEELTPERRTSCTDHIPQCKQSCAKALPCGHLCELTCHSGACMSCVKTVEITCRCGRTTSRTLCHQVREEPPQCGRSCKTLLNCGRHACSETCCPGERKAAERLGNKKKQRPLGSAPRILDDGFEAEHICTLQCGRLLKCGTHHCQELCHRGACGTCIEAIFDEISCHCGRTVLQPPLPCGTKPPPCSYPCTRSKTCGHQQVAHNCHEDNVPCPKCPYLVEKSCMCGKKSLKNQPCWFTEVRCGIVCGKRLKCGSHFCRKACHRSGECEDANGQACEQPCGKTKTCGHPDLEDTCHAPFSCKENKPCQSKIYITCNCQAIKQEMRCGASKTSEGNSRRTLSCNDECARLERNRRLALALDIDQSTHVDGGDHIPYSSTSLDIFAGNVQWAQTQEREFRVFADSVDEKRLRFKPMRSQQRTFIHSLAEDFGFDSESMDPEPHRHVMIWKTPRFVTAPRKTLADALRIRQAQRATNATTNPPDSEGQRTSNAPFNSFVISKPRFGLTIEELRIEVNALLRPEVPLTFDIEFLPSEDVVFKGVSRTLAPSDLEQMLQNMKEKFISAISSKGYGTPELCATDGSLNVLHRESESGKADGWSRVAAKKAAPKMNIATVGSTGQSNAFSALGSNKVTFTKRSPEKIKVKKEVVVDDWESAELAEEEKERATSGASGDEDVLASPLQSEPEALGSLERTSAVDRQPELENKTLAAFSLDAKSEPEEPAEATRVEKSEL